MTRLLESSCFYQCYYTYCQCIYLVVHVDVIQYNNRTCGRAEAFTASSTDLQPLLTVIRIQPNLVQSILARVKAPSISPYCVL